MSPKSLAAFVFVVFSLTALPALAADLPENFTHPDKRAETAGMRALKPFAEPASDLLSATDACAVQCSSSCVEFARQVINDCSGAPQPPRPPRPGPGPGPIPMPPNCIEDMRSFFSQRQGTSSDQDRADAISYCTSGADPACAPALKQKHTSRRTGTTTTQDLTDAAYACQNGASVACVDQVYAEYSRRSGTSVTQDVNDSIAACQRRHFP